MDKLSVDRARLVEYIKKHADELVLNADVDIDTDAILNDGKNMHFAATVRVRMEGIPLSKVKGKL